MRFQRLRVLILPLLLAPVLCRAQSLAGLHTQSNAAGLFVSIGAAWEISGDGGIARHGKVAGELQLLSGQEVVADPVLKVGGTVTQVSHSHQTIQPGLRVRRTPY